MLAKWTYYTIFLFFPGIIFFKTLEIDILMKAVILIGKNPIGFSNNTLNKESNE